MTDAKSAPSPVAYFYCNVKNSQDTLFCELSPATATSLPATLRGVLEPAKLDLYRDFEKALATTLPPRIAILRLESAESVNRRAASNIRDVIALGATLASLGFVGILWKARRRRHPGRVLTGRATRPRGAAPTMPCAVACRHEWFPVSSPPNSPKR